MRQVNTIVLASTNLKKYEEFKSLFFAYGNLNIVPAQELLRNADKLAQVEGSTSYVENAIAKARLANQGSHYPALGDDSGLEVEALGGAPGPLSARYARFTPGKTQDQANVEKLLAEMETKLGKSSPKETRAARFVATLALVIEGVCLHATGVLEGTIADSPRGENGFGYDPVFVPKGFSKTLAEMVPSEKNAISHRTKALQDLMNQASAMGIVFAKP